jgi:wyosine [tRNA(Phe)-imidazoG37] synthetase (radical SAM superfamily)
MIFGRGGFNFYHRIWMTNLTLSIHDHSRESAGLKYVYPVLSRRSRGLSIGINLNPNNACNWRCIYCQVPDLVRGNAPPIDRERLVQELRGFLGDIQSGDFGQHLHIAPGLQAIRDIAFSGNGEPTSAADFSKIVADVQTVASEFGLLDTIKLVLITNGSLMHRQDVQKGLALLSNANGEVWFKLDSATREGMRRINNNRLSPERALSNLRIAAGLCPTWIQTCWFAVDGQGPSSEEQEAYLQALKSLQHDKTPIQGVLLYGLARRSWQAEAPRLSALPVEYLQDIAAKIQSLGLKIVVNA